MQDARPELGMLLLRARAASAAPYAQSTSGGSAIFSAS